MCAPRVVHIATRQIERDNIRRATTEAAPKLWSSSEISEREREGHNLVNLALHRQLIKKIIKLFPLLLTLLMFECVFGALSVL